MKKICRILIKGNAKKWLDSAKNLVNRIETFRCVSTPASRKKLGNLAEKLILGILIILGAGTILWAVVDKPCNNGCGEKVNKPSETHLGTCGNCDRNIWKCPNLEHPHRTYCGHCGKQYWTCPGNSEALLHGWGCQFSGEGSEKNQIFNPSEEKHLNR